jgi:hypothetical protein
MATFNLAANSNIDALSGKTGGDLYNLLGYTLTIDQDSRVGTNQTTSTSLGTITVSATLGGVLNIDGTAIWLLAYTGGSGNVPAWNTTITQSGQSGTGKLIGVYSALTAASTATGAAMPASGFIKIKQTSGTFASGALTGITATSSGAGTTGWLEIVGDEASTITANRLGTVNITGAWFNIGTTSGSSNQTMQIPNNGLQRYAAGVYIEKTSGQGDYEFYPNAGTTTTTGTEATRGKVVWINNTGLVRIGNSGAATNGYTPASGLAVVVPNIFFENCTTAARTANVIPNATIATRYDFTCTGGGVVNIDKANMAWYGSFSQGYSTQITNSCFVDAILLSENATPITWSKVGVGNKPTTDLVTAGLTITYCYAGGTLTDCVWTKVTAASTTTTISLQDVVGFTFVRDTIRQNTIRGIATSYAGTITRAKNCTWTNPTVIQGSLNFVTCDGITVTDEIYCDCVSGTTVTTYAMYVWNLSSNTINSTFSGLTFPVTNTHPYTALLIGSTGCAGIKMRNIGTYASPLNLGSANATGLIYSVATNCSDFKIQRVYTSNTRTNTMTGDNSCHEFIEESCNGDYADAPVAAVLNLKRKNCMCTASATAQTSIYGTHWSDFHTSSTVSRLLLMMNEPTALTSSYITLTGGAAFTSAGGLYMPTVGQTATFEMDYYCIGHTGFANSALVMGGATVGNYRFEYSIDKNDGNGFSTMTTSSYTATQLGTALNGLTGISAVNGFKLKLKITTGTTNATAITSVYLVTASTTTTQAYQYPLDTFTLTLTGLQTGSDVVVYTAGTTTVLNSVDANSGTTWNHIYETPSTVDIGVFKAGYVPYYIRSYPLASSDASLPIAQVADRAYLL